MSRINIFAEIDIERNRQDAKWGVQNYYPIEWMTILTEEVGEAAKEAWEHHVGHDPQLRIVNYRKELVQVAAVAIAAIEALDKANAAKQEPDAHKKPSISSRLCRNAKTSIFEPSAIR